MNAKNLLVRLYWLVPAGKSLSIWKRFFFAANTHREIYIQLCASNLKKKAISEKLDESNFFFIISCLKKIEWKKLSNRIDEASVVRYEIACPGACDGRAKNTKIKIHRNRKMFENKNLNQIFTASMDAVCTKGGRWNKQSILLILQNKAHLYAIQEYVYSVYAFEIWA